MVSPRADSRAVMFAVSTTFRRLGQLTGFSPRQVLLAEAGVILKTWAGRTKVATQAKTDTRSRLAALRKLELTGKHGVTINAGIKGLHSYGAVYLRTSGGKWRRTHDGGFKPVKGMLGSGRRTKMGDHYTEHDWLLIKDAIAQTRALVPSYIQAGRRSIGIARQSVVQIADSLGIDLLRVQGGGSLSAAGIAKARAAMASTGRAYRNGHGFSGGDNLRSFVQLTNTLPYGRRIGMDRTLLGVLAGRAKFFQQSYAKGAFNAQRTAVRAYPNLFRFSTS